MNFPYIGYLKALHHCESIDVKADLTDITRTRLEECQGLWPLFPRSCSFLHTKKNSWEAIWLNSSKDGKKRNAWATRYNVDVAIELDPVNVVTGFIERLKENDVRQMSRCRNRILQRLWTK